MQKDAVNMCILYTDAQLTAYDRHIFQTVLPQIGKSLCSHRVFRVLISSQQPVACCSWIFVFG
jgi:hypothetical protein